jgi:integrase
MTKDRNHQGSTNFDHQDVFKDFTPPPTTDGSYKGTMKRKQATAEHLEKKFQEGLAELQQLLKQTKTKVGITVRGTTIQLQATLPPKPGSDKVKPYQQLISLGIPANLDGLVTAREDAFELGRLLARKQFEWTEKYLPVKVEHLNDKKLLLEYVIENYEREYFKTRKIAETSKHSCSKDLALLRRLKRFGVEEINQSTIDAFLVTVDSPSSKEGLIICFRTMAELFDIPLILTRPKRNKPSLRVPPDDDEIIRGFFLFKKRASSVRFTVAEFTDNWMVWEWVYGMLATYGLRPRELFMCPNLDWWLSSKNTHHTWRVHEDTKTGYREALPLHQEWVLLFDLKNEETIKLFEEYTRNRTGFVSAGSSVGNIARWFKKINLRFRPYDLRHAWAIRAHLLGVPIKAAADNLGHSVEMHTKTYQRWFSLENRIQSMDAAIARKSEVELLKDENVKLTIENDRLKIEVERYRLMAENPNFMR